MLRNTQDAEDVTQALFLDLLQKDRTDVTLPYLYRAATNRCLNLVRDRKRRQGLLDRQEICVTPTRTLCEGQLISVDLLTRLVGRLDKKTSEVLVYHFIDDMTQEEVAQFVGTSRKTIGKRVARIRKEMQRLTEESTPPGAAGGQR